MSWLYTHVLHQDEQREPLFAEQSAVNWAKALRFEAENEAGSTSREQVTFFRSHFRGRDKMAGSAAALGEVFEPLFAAVTEAMALTRMAREDVAAPWLRPIAVVAWYYATYGATRAMFAACGQPVEDTHANGMKAYASVLRTRMPHPFNMQARRTTGKNYFAQLPSYPSVPRFNISASFQPQRAVAQGMLLQYLAGSSAWYAEKVEQELKDRGRVESFRTADARKLRDERLADEIAFMHCAFRYRGKANYRDAIYLSYGTREAMGATFITDLAAVARVFVLVAFAFIERQMDEGTVSAFAADLSKNVRGIARAAGDEIFWREMFS